MMEQVYSEMLRAHLEVEWISRYMTLPGGGRESRKVMVSGGRRAGV